MKTSSNQLPPGFESLEPFVSLWNVEGSAKRAALRHASSDADRESFYHEAKAVLVDALAFLDKKSIADFDDKDRCLMNLVLSLAHVSQAIEIQGKDESKASELRDGMVITRSTADG